MPFDPPALQVLLLQGDAELAAEYGLCWVCAYIIYYHIERYLPIFQQSRLMIINPSAVQKYCQNKQF